VVLIRDVCHAPSWSGRLRTLFGPP